MFESLDRIQIISIIGSLIFLVGIVELIRKELLKEAYAILWLLFGLAFMGISFWKKGMDFFAEKLGIYYPPALLLLLLIVAVICVLIQFSVVISSQNNKIKTLTQEVALLKTRLQPKDSEKS